MAPAQRRSQPRLGITHEPWSTNGTTLVITGELDCSGTEELRRAVARATGEGHRHLVFDLTAAPFLDCAAIEALFSSLEPLRDDPDAAVAFAGADGVALRLLEVLELGQVVGMAELASAPSTCAAIRHRCRTAGAVIGPRHSGSIVPGRPHPRPAGVRDADARAKPGRTESVPTAVQRRSAGGSSDPTPSTTWTLHAMRDGS